MNTLITFPASLRYLPLLALGLIVTLSTATLADVEEAPDDPESLLELAPEGVEAGALADLLPRLAEGNFRDRAELAQSIAEAGHPRAAAVLSALLDGRLFATREEPLRVLVALGTSRDPEVAEAATGDRIGRASDFESRRIPVNNPMRRQLRSLIAAINLSHEDPLLRAAALDRLMHDGIDADLRSLLEERLASESNDRVLSRLKMTLAIANLDHDDTERRLDAIDTLTGSLLPVVRRNLERVSRNDSDPEVRQSAERALGAIQARISFFRFLENLFFGLSMGSVLLLAAIGLAITFGVMGVINMAHGELIMIGAYTTWMIQQLLPNHIEISILIAIPAAFLVAGIVGVAIERGVIRFLYGRPLETLLATFGISLILQQAVRSLFSPLNRAVSSPSWLSGSLEINPVLSLTYNRLYILIFSVIVFALLVLVLKRTDLGLRLRAVAQNRAMARAVGVRASWVDAMTFGLGAGIAGVAGVALSQLTNVGPNLGQAYIIDSFLVVVFGGVGNLWGTLVGAFGLGILNKFLEPWSGAVLAKILVLVFIILFIQKRPRGLFPQKGRAAEG